MKTLILLVMLSCTMENLKAQNFGDSTILNEIIFSSVEKAPRFPGGTKGFYKFLAENLEEPQIQSYRFSNKVIIAEIVIDQEGKVVYGKITKGLDEHYNNAVLKIFGKMPLWEPGLQNGKPVKCYQTIPIVFIHKE